jgi:uncharacterized protein (TIGR00369 family)
MSPSLNPKTIAASRVSLSQLMQPEHANNLGNVHGGHIMKLADECAALACMRHAGKRCVTVAMDRMTFRQPIRIGDLVTLTAEVTYAGRSSMEAEVHVVAENPLTGQQTHTNNAYLVFVALNEDGSRATVPPLVAGDEEEARRMEQAYKRQQNRLKQVKSE